MYYDNSDGPNSFQKENTHSLADKFLNPSEDFKWNSILDVIQKKRLESCGNYDASLGKIVNFRWTLNRDLSYDITVTVRSVGDVIESLKMNALSGYIYPIPTSLPYAPPAPPNSTNPPSFINIITGNVSQTNNTTVKTIDEYAYTHDIGALFYNIRIKLDSNPTFINDSNVDAVKISFNDNGVTTPQYYIRLGYFLQQLEKNIIYQLKNSDKTNPSKIIKFDYDINSNIILLYSRQLSANPNACIFKTKYNLSNGTKITLFPELNDFYLEGSGDTYSSFYGKIMNTYFSMSYILDQINKLKNADTGVLTLIDLLKILTRTFCESTGNYNKIEPTVDYETNIVKFIDDIKLPDFDAIISKLPGSNPSNVTARFDMFGYREVSPDSATAGVVRDLSLTTTVSPNLATMLTIGAQSNGYVTGQDSTALSVMNYGLKDRVKEEWIEPTNPNAYPSPSQPSQPPPTLNVKYKDVIASFNKFIQGMANKKWNQGDVTAFTNSIQSFAEYNQAEETLKKRTSLDGQLSSSPSIGFLPFDLTLTIDGLSGMKIYQKFVADTEFLPSNYPQSLEFLIKGITHEIKDNQWITTLESLAVPKNPFGVKEIFNVGEPESGQVSAINTNPAPPERAAGAGGPRPTGFTPTSVRTRKGSARSVTSGLPMKASAYRVANTNKTQIVLHYSAGQQTATAQESIDAVNNRTTGGFSYHYLILANGDVEQMIPDKDIAFHASAAGVNTHAIGVSFENFGWCYSPDKNSYNRIIPAGQTRAVQLVDFNGNPKSYKGHIYAQEITDAQLAALGPLIRKIKGKNPGITWPGLNSSTFETVFSERVIWSASKPGLYSHGAVQGDKADILPTPKIISALKLIGPL
jgi:hypothetical protein